MEDPFFLRGGVSVHRLVNIYEKGGGGGGGEALNKTQGNDFFS